MSSSENMKRWMLAVIFIAVALISISAVHASISSSLSSATGSIQNTIGKYKYAGVNALIIAALLFVIVAYFSKSLTDKTQRTIVQAIVLVFAIAIAFTNPLLKADYIWRLPWLSNILHLKVIVNLVVITAFIYFVASMFKLQDKMGGGQKGQAGLIILGLFVAFTIALAPFQNNQNYNDATYKYIWDSANVMEARYYLLGDSACTALPSGTSTDTSQLTADQKQSFFSALEGGKYCYSETALQNAVNGRSSNAAYTISVDSSDFGGFGVLRGKQLFIMLGLGLLLYWFLREWKIGTEMKFVQGLISVLITSSVVHSGTVSVDSAVFFGEALFGLVIYKAMAAQGTFKDKLAWLNWFLAAMLTEWIANLAFEKYAWTIFPYDIVTGLFTFIFGATLIQIIMFIVIPITGYVVVYLYSDSKFTTKASKITFGIIFGVNVGVAIFLYTSYITAVCLIAAAGISYLLRGKHKGIIIGIIVTIILFNGLVLFGFFSSSSPGDNVKIPNQTNEQPAPSLAIIAEYTPGIQNDGSGFRNLSNTSDLKKVVGGIILTIILLIVILLGFGKKGEGKNKSPLQGFMWIREHISKIKSDLLNMSPQINKLAEYFGVNRQYIHKGTIPLAFRQKQHVFMVLMNWLLRTEVFLNKAKTVEKKRDEAISFYQGLKEEDKKDDKVKAKSIGHETSLERFKAQVNIFKNGRRIHVLNNLSDDKIENRGDGNYYSEGQPFIYIDEVFDTPNQVEYDDPESTKGALETSSFVLSLFKGLATMNENLMSPQDIGGNLEGPIIEQLTTPVIRTIGNMNKSRGRFDAQFGKYCTIKLMNTRRIFVLNQYLMFGEYMHSYMFATGSAPVIYQKYKVVLKKDPYIGESLKGNWDVIFEKNRDGTPELHTGFEKDGKSTAAKAVSPDGKPAEGRPEIWFDGTFTNDYNAVTTNLKSGYWGVTGETSEGEATRIANDKYPCIRRVNPMLLYKNITHDKEFGEMAAFNFLEWTGWNADLIYGEFKQMSRSAKDYIEAYLNGDQMFRNVKKTMGNKNEEPENGDSEEENDKKGHAHSHVGSTRPAYDEEALYDPGNLNYWGRRYWNNEELAEINTEPPLNPFPGISVSGMTEFIKFYAEKKLRISEETLHNLEIYLYFSGDEKEPFAHIHEVLKQGEKK